jgi:hypothetical protein
MKVTKIMSGRLRRAVTLGLVTALATPLITACGGSPAPATPSHAGGSRLTQAQALRLAQVLYLDYKAGGARVSVVVPYGSGSTATLAGNADFKDHTGHLVVRTVVKGYRPQVQQVDYTSDAVYEKGGPVVAQEIAASGQAGAQWVERSPDPARRPLDAVIAIIVALASTQRDNPLLVQESDARWITTERVDGVETDVFRYNQAITYYIGVSDGLLYRFVGQVQGIAGPVTVDISERGPHPSPPPAPATVLRASRLFVIHDYRYKTQSTFT